ncbi:MAG TPA: LamG-like jellyroll fold domain-containing protein [Ohtaekwangia sp.]|nr:LamG-like jellyroll fold domain-containing protein [Ohtaekwangia sp.]
MRFFLLLITLILSGFISWAQVDLSNGLLGCYAFTGNANDKSGNENHGQVNGAGLTEDRFGNANSAYEFNGDDYIDIPASILKNFNYSYSVWAKVSINPSTGKSGIVFSIGDAVNSKHQTINVSRVFASDGFVGWNVGGYNDGLPGTTSLESLEMPLIDVWYHLVMTRGNNEMKMYINGILTRTGSTNGTPPYYGTDTRAYLGIRCNKTSSFYGAIDDFVIYDRVLTDQEVTTLFTDGIPCFDIQVSDVKRCGTGPVTLTAYGASQFNWYNDSGDLLFSGNPYETQDLSTSTSFYVAGVDGANETAKQKVEVTILEDVHFTPDFPEEVKIRDAVKYAITIDTGSPPYEISWNFDPDSFTSTSGEMLYTYNDFGKRLVKVLAKDANGCSYDIEKWIDVIHEPIAENISICGPGIATLTAQDGSHFRWYGSESGVDLLFEGNPYSHAINAPVDTIYVAAINGQGESRRKAVIVTSYSQPQIQCMFPSELSPIAMNELEVKVSGGTFPYNFSWKIGEEPVQITTAPEYAFTTKSIGEFKAQASVIDANGCTSSCEQSVSIRVELFIPNVITTNQDGKNEVFGLYYKFDGNYFLYEDDDGFLLQIFNRWGRPVYETSKPVNGWKGETESSGVYYYFIGVGKTKYTGWVQLIK